jgi:hypothetical protein
MQKIHIMSTDLSQCQMLPKLFEHIAENCQKLLNDDLKDLLKKLFTGSESDSVEYFMSSLKRFVQQAAVLVQIGANSNDRGAKCFKASKNPLIVMIVFLF